MTHFMKRAVVAFAAVAATGLVGAGAKGAATGAALPDVGIPADIGLRLALVDETNKLACYESADGFSCSALQGKTLDAGRARVEAISSGARTIMQKITDVEAGTVCYANTAGLWCAPLTAQGKASDAAEQPVFRVDVIDMAGAGAAYRVRDPSSGYALYTNAGGLGGAAMTKADVPEDVEGIFSVTSFTAAAMQRVRDYEAGVTCYIAPDARAGFACVSLSEDTTSGTDQRAILKANLPEMRYSVIDIGSNGVVVNVSDSGVCAAPWQPREDGDSRLDVKDAATLTGTKARRVIDEMLGVVSYGTDKGLSCGNLVPKAPAPGQ
ncbi:MAG: hypothetical protein HYU57_06825 [Micavibrio aeruginosavorus]|nr:hypothetical protein [Micavibrio aeruginosavorus]